MKRWAVITTLMYALLLLVLASPVAWLFLEFNWGQTGLKPFMDEPLKRVYTEPLMWGVFLVLVVCQAALILVPVGVAEKRLKARRHIFWPILTIGFLFANLVFWGGMSLGCLLVGDNKMLGPLASLTEAIQYRAENGMLVQLLGIKNFILQINDGWYLLVAILMVIMAIWLIWGGLFFRYYRNADAENWTRRWLQRVLKGSVLELLIVVPSHIVMRSREDCCAPAVSFVGIVMGLSVMLMCFGPGVLFLYLDRMRRLEPRKPDAEPPVDGIPDPP